METRHYSNLWWGLIAYLGWDVVHEFNVHAGGSLLAPRRTTSVPLAYGFFCATYDFLMATYFYTRRTHWRAAWKRDRSSDAVA